MAEKILSLYSQAHVVVAAVRLFSHREGKMPVAGDIAELTGYHMDHTHLLCNKLLDMGVLKVVRGAFDDRYHIGDHLLLEELPKTVDEDEMVKEVEKFKAESLEKKKKLEEMFSGKDLEQRKKDRLRELEDRFKDPKSGKKPNPLDRLTGSDPDRGEQS